MSKTVAVALKSEQAPEVEEVIDFRKSAPLTRELDEKVVAIDRISRTVKGGRRIRFRALVILGDRNGQVGVGLSKAGDVQSAIAKARNRAKKTLLNVKIVNDSIAHPIESTYGRTKVILKPAPAGHSIIAGGAVRPVLELAGIKNIVSKAIGSSNPLNSAMATYQALSRLGEGVKR
ncbi:MAG: 30S ribosomal protein S5 [Patescibacteria group bacterium]